jgi:glutaredoxin
MNRLSQRLLAAFDVLGGDSLEAGTLTEHAREHSAGDEQVLAELRRMAGRGLLREQDGRFYRTEDGRLAIVGARELTLYTRPGCHLCDEAKEKIAPLAERYGARLREVNIDEDPALRARHNEEVPVLFLGSRKVAKFKVDPEQLRRQLERAKAK